MTRGPPPPYAHTITLDGVNDFTTNENFLTSSVGFTGFIGWDADYLYFGMDGQDVGYSDDSRLAVVYVGGSPGTTTGQLYATQQPSLPFPARYHLRWVADGAQSGTTSVDVFNGESWEPSSVDTAMARSGTFVEFRIARADIGDPSSVRVHLNMVNETAGGEWSYAAVPSTSFADSYDSDYTRYFEFDLRSITVPNAHSPLP